MRCKLTAVVLIIALVLSMLPAYAESTKKPCSLTPLAPVIMDYSSNYVHLLWMSGYEFSMDGVTWQDGYAFTNLEPETEYRFYQRIKETDTQLASEISEVVVVTTPKAGITVADNFEKLVSFIDTYGEEDEDGYMTVGEWWSDEDGYIYYYILQNQGSSVLFTQMIDSENEDALVSVLQFELTKFNASTKIEMLLVLVYGGEIAGYAEVRQRFSRDTHTTVSDYSTNITESYLDEEQVEEYFNDAFDLMCVSFDSFLYYYLGFGLNGIGFVSYEGEGKPVCDTSANYHFGGTEVRCAREATCGIAGHQGYTHCLGCETRLMVGSSIAATGNHVYDNACDSVCNQCNFIRTTTHSYSNDYDSSCNVCGAIREVAEPDYRLTGTVTSYIDDGEIQILLYPVGASEPSYRASINGRVVTYEIENVESGNYRMVVSKNGHTSREYAVQVADTDVALDATIFPVGDVTGDGKVNMKDWNTMYEHVNELSELEGYAYLCADVNDDGIVSVKDWNRLYDHVNEVDPLW